MDGWLILAGSNAFRVEKVQSAEMNMRNIQNGVLCNLRMEFHALEVSRLHSGGTGVLVAAVENGISIISIWTHTPSSVVSVIC